MIWAPALRHAGYRRYFFGQMANWLGTWIQQLALGWWAYRVSGSVGWLAAIGVCAQLPILILGPWAASMADHVDRRKGVLATQSLLMLQAFAIMALHWSSKGDAWSIMALTLFSGCVNAFDIPMRQSLAARLVPLEDLRNAIAINALSANTARLVSPAIGGVVIAWGGEGACFMINCASYAAVLGALWSLPAQPAEAKREEGESSIEAFVAGARHVWGNPWMAAAMGMALGISLFATPYLSLMPALARDVFHAGPILYGFAMGASGIGAAASGLAMAAKPSVMAKSVMPWLGACGGLAMAVMASMPNAWWAMPFLAIVGFGLAGGASSANALVQSRVDPAMRGRVMGIFSMCLYGAAPLGIAAMGWLAERFGVRAAIEAGGLLSCVSCAAIGIAGMRGAFSPKVVAGAVSDSGLERKEAGLEALAAETQKT